jgi:drug/metabolite transporter (DMT)-like permease
MSPLARWRPKGAWGPCFALSLNAFVWGVSWWPFRWLQERGLHPLWATALIYALAVVVITLARPQAWGQLLRRPALWIIALASGSTNAAFNWGVTVGDVVRVVLLFYLMPLWAVLLARLLLHEALTRMALLRVAMALAGAIVVLWPAGTSAGWVDVPLPRTLPEWLGVVGGFTFALNNVMLKRESAQPETARALAMFVGGCLVAAVVAASLVVQDRISAPPPLQPDWTLGALAMGAAFLASNLALQYGAARLPANVTAVVMITEVLFASVSAVLLGAGSVTPALAAGGALIVAASLLAARRG